MKKTIILKFESVARVVCLLAVLSPLTARGQGTFLNLGFESPILPLDANDPTGVPIANALPGWSAYYGANQLSRVYYDTSSLGGASVSLHDGFSENFVPIQGAYSVLLQGSGAGPATSASIGQVGLLPIGAASIRFWASPLSNMQVTIDGQLIPLYALGAGPGYNILGGNIAAFAGQTHDLRFVGPANGGGFFDNIFFSNQPVPEPSVVALAGLAGLLWTGWWFRKR